MWVVSLKPGFGLEGFPEGVGFISIVDESVTNTVVSVCAKIELDKSQLKIKRMMWNLKTLKC